MFRWVVATPSRVRDWRHDCLVARVSGVIVATVDVELRRRQWVTWPVVGHRNPTWGVWFPLRGVAKATYSKYTPFPDPADWEQCQEKCLPSYIVASKVNNQALPLRPMYTESAIKQL